MPTLTQLEYILAVDRERNFSRAARSCHVSQPSLSSMIKKLEKELGTLIFDRNQTPITPTDMGIEIIAQARIVLSEASKLQHIANQGRKEPRGDFHLGVIPTLAPYMIPRFAGAYARSFPKVNLKISEMKTETIIRNLETDEIDAGLLVTPLHQKGILEATLFFEPFHVYVSDDHDLYGKSIIKEDELEQDSLWLLEEGHCFRDQALNVCSTREGASRISNLQLTSGNLTTLVQLIQRHSGYTLLPEMATYELSQEQRKSLRPFAPPTPTREISLVYSPRLYKKLIFSTLKQTILDQSPKDLIQQDSDGLKVVPI